jgi:hypothetical protein
MATAIHPDSAQTAIAPSTPSPNTSDAGHRRDAKQAKAAQAPMMTTRITKAPAAQRECGIRRRLEVSRSAGSRTSMPIRLGGRTPHILGAGTLRPLPDIELDAVTLTQIVESLAIDRTLMKKILLPWIVLDEPEALIDS